MSGKKGEQRSREVNCENEWFTLLIRRRGKEAAGEQGSEREALFREKGSSRGENLRTAGSRK